MFEEALPYVLDKIDEFSPEEVLALLMSTKNPPLKKNIGKKMLIEIVFKKLKDMSQLENYRDKTDLFVSLVENVYPIF